MADFDLDARPSRRDFDLDELLHPAQAFSHPSEVIADPGLTLNEKRAVLASWASDACAVESSPALRDARPERPPVGFDDVMDALRTLDKRATMQPRATGVVIDVAASSVIGAVTADLVQRPFKRDRQNTRRQLRRTGTRLATTCRAPACSRRDWGSTAAGSRIMAKNKEAAN